MTTDAAAPEREAPSPDRPGESIIDQSPRRKVGNSVYVSVPGPVPKIKARTPRK
ncbi:hypothetical protein ACWEVP_26690 [Amycolatopsis sp. NPDC003865]